MTSNCWVICHPDGSPYLEPEPHFSTQGHAIDAIKSLGPIAMLSARTGRLDDPCNHEET